jgi:aspartyl-tRNA(Asn)/glutamyl-tRNA(Gln) amidotransferase subunit B
MKVMKTFTPTIGIEVHAELRTRSKMFCGCPNNPHDAEPNTNICPVCLAHPGTLPVVNKEAVKHLVMVGNAVGGTIATYSEFDRKNYFYPDIPKAYQISQYQFPFVSGGSLAGVALTRVHLEEDTARSLHDQVEGSVIDFNRAGVPLMELVTEPVIHDAVTAGKFARELQLLLRTLGVSDANMERGEMRVEANISVSDTDTLGTKVEVKNLNSFRAMESAIQYEIDRQIAEISSNRAIFSETRGWDDQKSLTFSQRLKETANDYRYFPDPDIPKFDLSEIDEFSISRIREITPELPDSIRSKLGSFGVSRDSIEILLSEPDLAKFFNHVVSELSTSNEMVMAANYLTSDILGLQQNGSLSNLEDKFAPQFAALVRMVEQKKVTSRVAKDLLMEVMTNGVDPEKAAGDRNLLIVDSSEELMPIIVTIIEQNPAAVADVKSGKETAIQFLVGQGMKATRGSANPETLAKLFRESLLG